MDWEQIAFVATLSVGAVFLVMHVFALIAAFTVRGHKVKPFQSIMTHAAFVSGLALFVYVWNLGGEDERVRWLAYSLCSCVLILTYYEIKAMHNPKKPYPPLLWLAIACTFLAVSSGYLIAVQGLDPTLRIVAFVGAFAPFIAIPIALNAAIKQYTHGRIRLEVDGLIFGAFWWAYPLFYVLSPTVFGTITVAQAALGYVLADVVTKVAYEIYFGWMAYQIWIKCKGDARTYLHMAGGGSKRRHKRRGSDCTSSSETSISI